MPLTEKQREYLLRCDHRWNVKTGATGSGKSFVDFAVTIPKRILAAKGEGLLVLMGNTRGTLNRNILEPMRDIWPGNVGNIRSDNTIEMFGRKVYALGADNKKHVARIQGATFEYVYGDEVTTWSKEVFQMLKSRLRCEHSHFDGTCNPDNPNHWFKAFLDSDADIYQQNYVIDDGVLPANTVAELKKEYAGTVYFDRYILGKWRQAEGLVYPMFNREKHMYTLPPWNEDTGEYYVSVDYGTLNPTSMGLWRIYAGRAYRVKEYYYSGRENNRQLTDEEYYAALENLVRDKVVQYVVVDPSAASFMTTIRKHGRFSVRQANNAVLDGLRYTATALNGGLIQIHESCKDIVKEFEVYSWDEQAGEDKVIKENDHAMDDMRYFVMTVLRRFMR